MNMIASKNYQKDAVKSALEIFRFAESQIQVATDIESRATATAYNGCILLEAPTGSGKTRIAGTIAEEFSKTEQHPFNSKIVWFWFTPFSGLTEQTALAMKNQFQGLRIRDLYTERNVSNIASGDVFVTTWGSVAANKAETRRIRKSGDHFVALDEFIPALRELNYRIEVVVDEAHHGFTKAKEAISVYREVIRPDFTLLVTATPDDNDVKKFQTLVGIHELHRIRISRKDAVEAGLIKVGIKSIAYLAPDDQKPLVDFGLTALADAWQMHQLIKSQISALGLNLTPLLLVQVGNSDKAIDEAKKRLKILGVPEETIAWYTAEDPNDDLLTVAKDETKQILIFKVAVALGFDAPRAFTLVSLRGTQDTDFGIQVVGRILRVHPLLQSRAISKSLPEILQYGYVFLADAENQSGLTSAGERINSIKTEMSGICPNTMVVNVAGQNQVQVLKDGRQSSLLPEKFHPLWISSDVLSTADYTVPSTGLMSTLMLELQSINNKTSKISTPLAIQGETVSLRFEAPKCFITERLPLSSDQLVKCVGLSIAFDDKVIKAGLRRSVKVKRTRVDIFDGTHEIEDVLAKLSDADIAARAQGVLFDAHHIDPRDLLNVLLERLKKEYDEDGIEIDQEDLIKSLYLIMATYPHLIKRAARACAAKYKEVIDAAALPISVELEPGAQKSRLNAYGFSPVSLNNTEREFASLMDSDTSDTIEWWIRNEPNKPHSVGIVMPSGDRYFPDFIVKVKDRQLGSGILLVEIKGNHILNGSDTLEKVIAEHKIYGRPLMLVKEPDGRFMTVRYNQRTDKNEADQVFRLGNMSEY